MRKTNLKVMGCIALVGCITLSIAGCNSNNAKEVKSTESVAESTEAPEVKLTDKVTGIKDWTVEVNSTGIDFMKDVSWNKDFVSTVTVDDSDVDLTKVGKYTLTYTIKGITSKEETQDASVDVTEVKATESEESTETQTATVDVISEEDTQAKVNDGGSVTTSTNEEKGTTQASNSPSNNSGKSTTTTPVAETPKAHEHDFSKVVWKTVHHDAVTHTEQQDQGHNETTTNWVYVMSDGTEFTNEQEAREYRKQAALNGNMSMNVGVVSRETTTWVPNVVTVTVVDTEAYDEQVIDHYECSCGATK